MMPPRQPPEPAPASPDMGGGAAAAVEAPSSEEITRKSASNLAMAFVLLPPEKRAAMAALYAFCRMVDDAADEDRLPVAERARNLQRWREDVERACTGGTPIERVNRELQPVIDRYRLPFRLFDDLIRGCEMDLTQTRYADVPGVERYCYHVASVVGLLSIEIFGYKDPGCRDYAVHLGKALQWTNILRDVGNDARRGRVYLPADAMARFGVTAEDILEGRDSDQLRACVASLAGHAREHYRMAREALPAVDRRSMIAAELMGAVYWRLLKELERRRFPVLAHPPVRLSRWRKVLLVMLAAARIRCGFRVAQYGV